MIRKKLLLLTSLLMCGCTEENTNAGIKYSYSSICDGKDEIKVLFQNLSSRVDSSMGMSYANMNGAELIILDGKCNLLTKNINYIKSSYFVNNRTFVPVSHQVLDEESFNKFSDSVQLERWEKKETGSSEIHDFYSTIYFKVNDTEFYCVSCSVYQDITTSIRENISSLHNNASFLKNDALWTSDLYKVNEEQALQIRKQINRGDIYAIPVDDVFLSHFKLYDMIKDEVGCVNEYELSGNIAKSIINYWINYISRDDIPQDNNYLLFRDETEDEFYILYIRESLGGYEKHLNKTSPPFLCTAA